MRPAPMLLSALLMSAPLLAACSNDAPPAPAAATAPVDAAATADPAMAPADAMPAAPAEAPADAATPPATDATADAPAESTPAAPAEFDPASVPESTATLPPFPFFAIPDGLVSIIPKREAAADFDREHMIAGDKVVVVEGKVARDRFFLEDADARVYSDVEYHRVYADAIAKLGGVEVSRTQYTNEVNDAFGGREAVDRRYHGTCASDGCENHTYLIRQGGKEWWIQVSSGAIPLHGEVVVLERQAMTNTLSYLSADQMKSTIDATGRLALYVNFDHDRATLRPDAAPVLDEVGKMLTADPALRLSVEGHTDGTGSADRNRELSAQRAEAVVAALVARGIDAGRLTSQGFGADRPLVVETDDHTRAQNRRVELVRVD